MSFGFRRMSAPVIAALWLVSLPSSAVVAADIEVQPRHVYPARILEAQATLTYRMIADLAGHASVPQNIVVSPAGVAAVLSLLDVGASARMHAAIHRTLGFSGGSDLEQTIDLGRTRGVWADLAKVGEMPGPLALGNLLVFDPAMKPHRNALLQLAAAGADVEVEDLSKPAVLAQINEWVGDRTRGAIPSILDQPPRDKSLLAINALYFADRWERPFDAGETQTEPFHAQARDINVRMMHSYSEEYLYRMEGRFIAVELPYQTPAYSMVVITTTDRPASPHEFASVAKWLTAGHFRAHRGDVSLPKFSLTDQRSILPTLDRLGLRRGRISPGALAGFSSRVLQISRILQSTIIKTDERGTVAASATAAVLERAMPHEFVRIVVDKPFLFALLDKKAGLVVIAGYVAEPKM